MDASFDIPVYIRWNLDKVEGVVMLILALSIFSFMADATKDMSFSMILVVLLMVLVLLFTKALVVSNKALPKKLPKLEKSKKPKKRQKKK